MPIAQDSQGNPIYGVGGNPALGASQYNSQGQVATATPAGLQMPAGYPASSANPPSAPTPIADNTQQPNQVPNPPNATQTTNASDSSLPAGQTSTPNISPSSTNPMNGSFTNPGGTFSSSNIAGTQPPNLYDLYQQELQNRGVTTSLQQEQQINQQIAGFQNVLNPLTPQMVQAQIPGSLSQLTQSGITQDQLALQAAQASAPIATAMNLLLQSRSAVSNYISQQEALSQNAVNIAQQEYQNKLQLASYDFTQIGSHVNALGQTVPDYGYVNKVTGKIMPATSPDSSNITNNQFQTQGFPSSQINNLISTRQILGQKQLEYYNTQTGQGFSTPQALADFYNKQTGTNGATAQNIFSILSSGTNNGSSGVTSFTGTANSRTDRNNNPIASSIAVNPDGTPNMNDPTTNEWLTALSNTGIPYTIEQGANFGNRATISFSTPQAGLEGARTLLSTSAFSWYKKTWSNAFPSNIQTQEQFMAAPKATQDSIIQAIYAHEQPGGQLFNQSANKTNVPQAVQNQINSLPPLMQKYVNTSPSGYAFINANAPDTFRTAIAANPANQDIIPLSADNAQKEQSLITGMNMIGSAQTLIDNMNLPTDPLDPDRLVNGFNEAMQNSPQFAQLNQYWQAAIQTLSGLGVTGLRSSMLIDKAALSDYPRATSIESVAKAQLSGIMNLVQIEERGIMGRSAPIDYSGQAQNILNGSVTNGQSPLYDTLNQIWGNINSASTTLSLLTPK